MKRRNIVGLVFSILLLTSCQEKQVMVELQTEYGNMKIALFNETPKHRDNFVKLVKEGYYSDLLFHRIIAGFMIQGGDPNSKNATPDQRLGNGDLGYTIPAEFGQLHYKGRLAAARTPDAVNPDKESSSCQFYIVHGTMFQETMLDKMESRHPRKYTDEERKKYLELGGTPNLDFNYTVFGEVVEGIELIPKIAISKTNRATNRPIKDIKFTIKMIED